MVLLTINKPSDIELIVKRINGFSLMEILVVITIIAVLAVGMMAVLDPMDKVNKASDAITESDASEMVHAMQRYYVNKDSLPWVDVDGGATVHSTNDEWFGRSDYNGFGLCSLGSAASPNTRCTSYSANPGELITAEEVKSSLLGKGYTSILMGDPKYDANGMNYLWVDKKETVAAELGSISVCFIPKAKSDRKKSNNLKKPVLTDGNVTGLADTEDGDFSGDRPITDWNFQIPKKSLFKCVP